MTFQDYQQQLTQCFSSQDQNIQVAAQQANNYTEMLKAGQLNKQEYQELLLDMQRSAAITQSIDQAGYALMLNNVINGLLSVSSFL
jgi:hypothetical protein